MQSWLTSVNSSAFAPEIDKTGAPVAAPPVFSIVTTTSELLEPNATEPKSDIAGVAVSSAGATPVPVSAAVAMPPGVPLTRRRAARAPLIEGVNCTEMVHVALGISVLPAHLSSVIAKSPGLVPVIVTPSVPLRAAPMLVIVMSSDALGVPIAMLAKSCTLGVATKSPLAPMAVKFAVPVSVPPVTSRVAVLLPVESGAKRASTMQEPPAATLMPVHVLETMANSAALAPVIAVAKTGVAVAPGLRTMKLTVALNMPTRMLPKSCVAGVISRPAGVRPVALKAALTEPPGLTVNVSDALCIAAAVGRCVTSIVQLALAPSVMPVQVSMPSTN